MSRTFLILLVVVAVFAMASAQRCPPNEEFTSCGSACEPSCQRRRTQACTLQCIVGCQCRRGFKRNSNGRCVSRC